MEQNGGRERVYGTCLWFILINQPFGSHLGSSSHLGSILATNVLFKINMDCNNTYLMLIDLFPWTMNHTSVLGGLVLFTASEAQWTKYRHRCEFIADTFGYLWVDFVPCYPYNCRAGPLSLASALVPWQAPRIASRKYNGSIISYSTQNEVQRTHATYCQSRESCWGVLRWTTSGTSQHTISPWNVKMVATTRLQDSYIEEYLGDGLTWRMNATEKIFCGKSEFQVTHPRKHRLQRPTCRKHRHISISMSAALSPTSS